MAFDINKFVQSKGGLQSGQGQTGGFNVNEFVKQKGAEVKSSGFNIDSFLKSKGVTPKRDLSTIEGLSALAVDQGLEDEVNKILDKTPRLSVLQRLGAGLGAFNPAEAILTGVENKSFLSGVSEYVKGVGKGLASAVTGNDYDETTRRTFADVAEKLGVENSVAKFGIGLVGDILLDPTTYFGGAIAKGILKGASAGTNVALKGVGKLAPQTETGLRLAGQGIKDAAGKAFVFGYGTTKGVSERFLEITSRIGAAKEEAVVSNLNRLGTGVLSPSQQEELVFKMLSGKKAELDVGRGTKAGKEAAKKAGRSDDPMVQAAIEEQTKRSRELSAIAGIEDPFEIYFPSLKADKLKNFIEGTRPLRVGSEEYRKQFRNLLGDDEIIKDPVQAFATREFQIMKDKIVRNELTGLVNDFGKPARAFKDEADAVAQGYTPVYEKGSPIAFYKGKFEPAQQILDQIDRQGFRGNIVKPQTLEQSFVKVGKAIQFAQESGLSVQKLRGGGRNVGGSATLGGIERGGKVNLKAFTSDVIAHELAHAFDTNLSKQIINKSRTFKEELSKVVKFTGLGGSDAYRSSAVERFAEFTDLYIHNPGQAKKLAPKFAEYFENELLPNQKVGELVSKLSDFFQKVDGLPNIKTPLKELDDNNYLETAIRTAFPEKKFIGVRNVKPIGYLPKADNEFIQGLTNDKLTSIDMIAKATGFDAITSLFKRSVTGLFAPFHVRNYVSGMIQNFEVLGKDALDPRTIASAQKLSLKLLKGETFPDVIAPGGEKLPELMKRFKDRFGTGDSYIADIENATKGIGIEKPLFEKGTFKPSGEGFKQAAKETLKTAGLGQSSLPFRTARAVGQFVETQQKMTAYLAALGQGKSVDEALKLAERSGFDYRALTKFESKVLRRVIPFYSFTRKNIELQLRTLGEHPERINQIIATLENTGELFGGRITPDEKQNLPDYLKNSLGIKIGDTPEGLKEYISSFGTPIEAFTNLFSDNPVLNGISQMNPLLKVPIEIGIGKDSFRKKDLKDVYDAREYSNAPQFVKDLLDLKEVKKPILQKDASGKLREVGERTVYVADPVKLLIARSLFTSRGVTYLDTLFGDDLEGFAKAVKLSTGIKPVQIDLEAVAGVKERDQKRALEDLLIKKGEGVSKFQNVFQTK